MLTKLPDYIITECGYPNWDREKEHLNLVQIRETLWSTNSIWSKKSTNLAKLLPLRETLTDYYMDKLLMSQNESIYKTTATKTTTTQYCNKNNSNCGRQAPRHVNEVIKNGKRKPQQLKKQQCVLDKRRTQANGLDKDLDQF